MQFSGFLVQRSLPLGPGFCSTSPASISKRRASPGKLALHAKKTGTSLSEFVNGGVLCRCDGGAVVMFLQDVMEVLVRWDFAEVQMR